MSDWLHKVARLLQFIGLVLLPVAIAGNLIPQESGNALTLGQSLTLTAVGICAFGVGYSIQQYTKPSE